MSSTPKVQGGIGGSRLEMTPEVIEGFQAAFLMRNYDELAATPACHRRWWKALLRSDRYVAIAAPRNHAKSTAITHAGTLSQLSFRRIRHACVVGNTEEAAAQFIKNMKYEILHNEDLQKAFPVDRVLVDNDTEFVWVYADSSTKEMKWSRLIAKGAKQKPRGMNYLTVRPDYMIFDDIEDDEAVESDFQRQKLRKLVFGAFLPALSTNGRARVVGTVLHFDGFLWRLTSNPSWYTEIYEANNDDFTNILWPERWPKEALKREMEMMLADGQLDAYYREYRNRPMATSNRKLDPELIIDLRREHFPPLTVYAAVDLAITKAARGDYSTIVVVGVDHEGGAYILDVTRARMELDQSVEAMYATQGEHGVLTWLVEKGVLKLALQTILDMRGRETGIYLNIESENLMPGKDKDVRAGPFSARIRQRRVYADKTSHWWGVYAAELAMFPAGGSSKDDQVDATSLVFLHLNHLALARTKEEIEEQMLSDEFNDHMASPGVDSEGFMWYPGRDDITGY